MVAQFPRLSIIWSQSVQETVKIFQRLKEGQPEPIPEEVRDLGKEIITANGNIQGQNLLRSFPGVTEGSAMALMHRYRNLAEIASANKADLEEIMGLEAAKAFIEFLDQEHVPTQLRLN